jgi:hypothetical protein
VGDKNQKEVTSFEEYMKVYLPRKWKAMAEGGFPTGEDDGEDDE